MQLFGQFTMFTILVCLALCFLAFCVLALANQQDTQSSAEDILAEQSTILIIFF